AQAPDARGGVLLLRHPCGGRGAGRVDAPVGRLLVRLRARGEEGRRALAARAPGGRRRERRVAAVNVDAVRGGGGSRGAPVLGRLGLRGVQLAAQLAHGRTLVVELGGDPLVHAPRRLVGLVG